MKTEWEVHGDELVVSGEGSGGSGQKNHLGDVNLMTEHVDKFYPIQ